MQFEAFIGLLKRAQSDFPAAFPGKGKPARPLAIGVDKALLWAWPDMAKAIVHEFMAVYCGSPAYLRAIKAGGSRYRLDGESEGEVSADQQAHAAGRLDRLAQRRKEFKRKARPDPDKPAAAPSVAAVAGGTTETCPNTPAATTQPPARKTFHLAAAARRKLDVRRVEEVQVVTIRRRAPAASGRVLKSETATEKQRSAPLRERGAP